MENSIIWGTDDAGIVFYQQIDHEKINIVAFIDNKNEQAFNLPVYRPEMLYRIQFDKIYIATPNKYEDAVQQCLSLGISADRISLEPLRNVIFSKGIYDWKNRQKAELLANIQIYNSAYHAKEYEKRWEDVRKRYQCIKIMKFREETMGESIARFLNIIKYENVEQGTLLVLLPIMLFERIYNLEILKFLGQRICIPQGDDLRFWEYVVRNHFDELDISDIDKYNNRGWLPAYKITPYEHDFRFSREQEKKGKSFLNKVKLKGDYVCLFSRDGDYNLNTAKEDSIKENEIKAYAYRNMKFESYKQTIEYLKAQGITAVRMGRGAKPMDSLDNCIDYAGQYADDFLDMYLPAHCRFVISPNSGAFFLGSMFGIPVLQVNVSGISYGAGGQPYTDKDMLIPKKYYDKSRERFLSLLEIAEVEARCMIWGQNYAAMGIEFVDDTPQEILEAVIEFWNNLNETQEYSEEDEQLQRRYHEICKIMDAKSLINKNNWTGGVQPARIATSFLRKNQWLLQ